MMSSCLRWLFVALFSATLVGCMFKASKSQVESQSREVNLAIWSNYLSVEAQERFMKETGIRLRISYYSSNEELLAKVQAGAAGIDVAVPSDYMVEVLGKLGLLRELDKKKIANAAGVHPDYLGQDYDPENRFSLPYAWSTAGIAVHRDLFKGSITSWKDLFENSGLAGRVSLLDDVREVMAAALKMQGESVNTTDPEKIKKAQAALKTLRPRIKMFRSDTIEALVNKEIAVAQAYSPDALQAIRKSGGRIEYILPAEGGTRTIDNLVILKSAKNIEAAHALINFLLSRESNVDFVSTAFGGPVLSETKELLPAELSKNPSLFPEKGRLAKFERIKDLGEATVTYDRLWTELKSE